MRQIGTVPDEKDARRLADYLLTLDITTRVDAPGLDGSAVWVHREEQVEEGRRELRAFLDDPQDERYRGVEATAQARRREAERQERAHSKNSIPLDGRWDGRATGRRPLTLALIAASCLVGAQSHIGEDLDSLQKLLLPKGILIQILEGGDAGRVEPHVLLGDGLALVRSGEVWRLLTPIFVHFGPMHLAFNMLVLYDLGGLIESRRGTARLAGIVLLSAVGSNLAEYFWSAPGTSFGGMSGVDYALLGFAWMRGRYDATSGLHVREATVRFMLAWLVLCAVGMVGRVANAAHVGGLLIGMGMGIAPSLPRLLRRWI